MYDGFYKQLGENIKTRRQELYYTQQELADKVNMSLNFIGKIEVAFSRPSLNTLITIAEALNSTISDITKGCK